MFASISLIIGLVAIFGIINHKWLKLPFTISLSIQSIIFMLLFYLAKPLIPDIFDFFCNLIYNSDFEHLLFDAMLGFLLFAGALHVNIKELSKEKWPVLIFATAGVLISTFLVGIGTFYLAKLFGINIPFIYSLLFGALISPTDPISVLAILKETSISKSVQLKIEGEALFNDGIGVVVFAAILLLIPNMELRESSRLLSEISLLFVEEAIGGLAFGVFLGFLGYYLIKENCSSPQLSVLISIAIVMSGYAIASLLHVSGPLAMVIAGLIIGNKLHVNEELNNKSIKLLNEVWEMLDEILNGVLFVLMGLSIHLLGFNWNYIWLGILSIFVVLFARFISLNSTYFLIQHKQDKHSNQTMKILTWGGLRGGISIALALSLGEYPFGQIIITITLIVVIFSILVQGLTIGWLVKKFE